MKILIKDENGFTLVELIAVMALLAVLSVIGISRYAGITDETRLQADYYLASAVASSAQARIAEGDSKHTDSTIDIQDLKDDGYLIEGIDYKAQTNDQFFTIEYDQSDNSIKVKTGNIQFYPIP